MQEIVQFSEQNVLDLKEILAKVHGDRFLEIGCWTGHSTSYIAEELRNRHGFEMVVIDTFRGSVGTEIGEPENHVGIREKFSNKNVVAWAAVLGNNYYNTIDYVLDDYMLPRANIIILSDSNIKESRYQFLRRNPRVVDLEIYWNKFGSDFGEHPVELIKSHSLVRRRPYEQVDGHFYKNKKRTQYNKK